MLAQTGFNQSQSSVSNDISGKEKVVHGGSGDLCTMCKSKPAAVSLTACGHDVFCFKCISGVEKCPVCTKDIAGWVPIPQKSIVRASLVSPAAATDEPEGPEESDDEDSAGLVHWCDQDVFSQGGLQTVVGTDSNEKSGLEVTEAESPTEETRGEERPHNESTQSPTSIEEQVPEPQKTFSRRASRTVAEESTPAVGDVETLSAKPAGTLSKKRGRKLFDVETLNHTCLMERPLSEILVEAPVYVEPVSKPRGKNVQPELTFAGSQVRVLFFKAAYCHYLIESNSLLAFIKGTRIAPQCGFRTEC